MDWNMLYSNAAPPTWEQVTKLRCYVAIDLKTGEFKPEIGRAHV